ncbi:hypothetical protein J1614_009655 [Plenodomus biglobosus]|nr:hypothetical protein J1614_009655 [Plenodomus biglobosus]
MPQTRAKQRDIAPHDDSSNDALSSPPESPSSPPSTSFKTHLRKFEFQEKDSSHKTPSTRSQTTASISPSLPTLHKRLLPPTSPTTPQRKKQKRPSSRYAPPSQYAHLPPLPDILAQDLICIFVGTNPGIGTARAGHAYAHPSNLFWKLLHTSGLTERRLAPQEDRSLPALYAMGNTNIVERPSRDAGELSKGEMVDGARVLEEKIRKFRPEAVCIVGKGIWEAIWRWRVGRGMKREEFRYGWQDWEMNMGRVEGGDGEEGDGWEGARVFVTTSTSGLAAGLSLAEKEEIWRPFGEWVRKRREERGWVPQVVASEGSNEHVPDA